jgi:hypothetical protein
MILHRPATSSGHRIWVALITALVLAFPLLEQPAAGQGTTGTLPDPISTRELTRYADRLQLDASQRLAIESIHDEYKSAFRKLRDDEIADFLEEMRSWQGMGMMPQREVVESFFKEMEKLRAMIKKLDDRLFDRLLPVLTDEQQPMLARVRLARERKRYQAQQMMSMTGPAVDLSEVVLALDLEPDLQAEVDPVIAPYERRLTLTMRKVSEAASRMYLDMFDAFEALGYGGMTEEDLADPEAMTKMMEDMRQIWSEIGGKITELAAQIANLNRKTYRRVAAFLPPETARDFRARYYRQAYPELRFMFGMDRQKWFERTTERDDLSDEQRQAVTAAVDGYRQRLDLMVDDAVKLIDARRATSSVFDFDMEGMREHMEQLAKVRTKAQELMSATMGTINDIVGEGAKPGAVEDAQQEALALAGVDDVLGLESGDDTDAEAEEAGERARRSARRIDQWVPGPISRHDVNRYAEKLSLDDVKRAELQELHAEYSQRFGALEAVAELPAANQSLWQYDAKTGTAQPPTEEALEKVDQLRRKAMAEIARLEQTFFAEVQAIVPDEHVQTIARLQARRQRQTYNTGAGGFSGSARSAENRIDLVELVDDRVLQLEGEDVQRVDSILAGYEDRATALFRQQFEAQLVFQQAQQKWAIEARALQDDPGAMLDYARRYQEIMSDASEKLGEAARNVAKLNRQTVEALIEALPEAAGSSVRRTYNHKAFPSIYNDPVSVDRHLTRALTLDDLTDEQREYLDSLTEAYRPEYERLCQAMVARADREQTNPMSFDSADWQEYQKREEQLQRIRFDRDELSYRAINRLKAVLSPEQIERIGGLPKVKEDEPIISW